MLTDTQFQNEALMVTRESCPSALEDVNLEIDQIPAHNHNGRTGGQNLSLNYKGVEWNTRGESSGILVSVDKPAPKWYPNALTTRGHERIKILPQNHSHVINTQGGGKPHENRPQFYALAFIMRLP